MLKLFIENEVFYEGIIAPVKLVKYKNEFYILVETNDVKTRTGHQLSTSCGKGRYVGQAEGLKFYLNEYEQKRMNMYEAMLQSEVK